MKKVYEKYKPVPETLKEDEQKISSSALTFQLLNKEKERNKEAEKKESASEAAKVRCKICFKEIAPKRLCSGHGGGGGGGSEKDSFDEKLEENALPTEDKPLTKPGKGNETTDELLEELDSDSNFDPEIIAELIAEGLLLIDNDRESMTFAIQLRCEPHDLTKEQREQLKKIFGSDNKRMESV